MNGLELATAGLSVLTLTTWGAVERLPTNAPQGELRDLKVGLWALPMPTDWDGDGKTDLVVSCPCGPYRGTYLFRNRGDDTFAKAEKLCAQGYFGVSLCETDGRKVVVRPGLADWDFRRELFAKSRPLGPKANPHPHGVRGNKWRLVDYDGDGRDDLVIGVGCWKDYGWDDAYDAHGVWTNGPVRTALYLCRNVSGRGPEARYAAAVELRQRDGTAFETEGNPSPMFSDFDGDGDLDLLCGSFVDDFTYFENVGTRTTPSYEFRGKAVTASGERLTMDLEMIEPTLCAWNGSPAVICGDEDGRVARLRFTGSFRDGVPVFEPPHYFRQEADDVNFGALATPWTVDWDGDGDLDLVSGNSAGCLAVIENLSGSGVARPRWGEPRRLRANGRDIRIMAGANGSIQGPVERKWGYTVCSAADWDGDGFDDLVVNSIFGDIVWYRNPGRKGTLDLEAARPVEVEWEGPPPELAWGWRKPKGKALLTQWRTTPVAIDWNGDGLVDLVVLDTEGYLGLFERFRADGGLRLKPPRRAFADAQGRPLRLNDRRAGGSGRRKICFADWDGDGRLDLIANGRNADFWRNLGTQAGVTRFAAPQPLADTVLSNHTTAPCPCDFNGDGRTDLLIGAEDGYFYLMENGGPSAGNRPETWFHFIDGNVSKEGIIADLDAIRDAGIGGVQFFHGGWNRGTWPDVTNPVTCLSSNWTEVVRFLADEAEKRNLKFTMQNCPGWSMSGGPWITPEKAMRNLTCDRVDVESDGRTPLAVWPEPSAVRPEQDYRDVIALAFPTPAGDAVRPVAVTNLFGAYPPAPVTGTSFTFDLGEPRFVRTVELSSPKDYNGHYPSCPDCRVRIEADGVAVADVPMPASCWQCKVPWSIACDETTARVWRVTFFNTRKLDAHRRSVRFLSGARLDNYEGQAGWTLRGLVRRPDPKQSAAAFVRRSEIREVRRGDTLPKGKWTILRLGHVNTCLRNAPAPQEATGWECNKLDAEIVREHFDNYIGRALRDGIRVKGVLLDSWECERQTWTAKLPGLFRARSGYDFTALLPALFGYVIDTPDETRKFLLDFRGTIGNLIEENYYRTMSDLAHAHGLDIRYETAFGDVIPGDTLRFWKYADEPMCEFWQPMADGYVGSTHFKPVRPCVSAAHVYGKKRVSAEAFTSFALTWNEDFNLLKPLADMNFARGVTHLVFHTYTHNPSVDPRRRPGTSFGWGIGTPFLRGQTWWPYMRDFTDYLARCQAILESGRPVVDVLRYLGDDLDIRPNDDEPFPSGYQRDYCNADALAALPAGHKYRVLWIPTNTFVSAATEGLIAKSGLRVIRGELKPDWPADVTTESASRDPLQWYHRQAEDGDWYFLAAWTNGWTGKVSFRAGGAAQLDLAPGESLFAHIAGGKLSLVDPLSGKEVKREVKSKVEVEQRSLTILSTPTPSTYTFTSSGLKPGSQVILDLGEVYSWATVKVNGREAARLWCRPYRCDITEFVRDGENEVSVEVTSTWRNRLIREAALPEAERTTWVIDGPAADAPLVPEGLLGPVRLFAR